MNKLSYFSLACISLFVFMSTKTFSQENYIQTSFNLKETDLTRKVVVEFEPNLDDPSFADHATVKIDGISSPSSDSYKLYIDGNEFTDQARIIVDGSSLKFKVAKEIKTILKEQVKTKENPLQLRLSLMKKGGATKVDLNTFAFIKEDDDPSAVVATQYPQEIYNYVNERYSAFSSYIRERKNNIIKVNNTVHIFVDEFGRTYFTGWPTTSREDYSYTIHLFYYYDGANEKNFVASFDGVFEPVFEIYNNPKVTGASTSALKDNSDKPLVGVKEVIFSNNGPYTGSFTVKIAEKDSSQLLVNKTINVAKTHHISLSAGLVSSFLKDPSGFEKYPLDGGDSTLIADDPESRGLITLMATFYPKPRNLLFPPTNWQERIGFVVGTRIDKNFNENFLSGVSYDVARGMALTAGAHYGRVNKLVYDGDFTFGETPYSREIKSKKEWKVGWYFGLVIDLRVFGVLFNPTSQAGI
ncbi:MAG: hypothetical protein R2757_19230 [Draconibacterium sp.]